MLNSKIESVPPEFSKFTDATIWICARWKTFKQKGSTQLRQKFGFKESA